MGSLSALPITAAFQTASGRPFAAALHDVAKECVTANKGGPHVCYQINVAHTPITKWASLTRHDTGWERTDGYVLSAFRETDQPGSLQWRRISWKITCITVIYTADISVVIPEQLKLTQGDVHGHRLLARQRKKTKARKKSTQQPTSSTDKQVLVYSLERNALFVDVMHHRKCRGQYNLNVTHLRRETQQTGNYVRVVGGTWRTAWK